MDRPHVGALRSDVTARTFPRQQRDALAVQIIQLLEGAEFNGQSIDFKTTASLVSQANKLLEQVNHLQHGD